MARTASPTTNPIPPDQGQVRLLLPAAAAFVVAVAFAVFARGLAGDEEAVHYLLARYAPGSPRLFLSVAGRPLVTLALALPAQAGFLGARFASAAATALAAYLVARLARRTGWVHPTWAVTFFLLQPFLLAHAGTAMTEPWTAALVALALVAYVEDRPSWLAVVAALLPLARFEALAFWPFVAWILWRGRRIRLLALLPVPLLLWNLGGTLATGDPIWLLHQAQVRAYPQRSAFHYLQSLAWILGAGLLVPVLVGTAAALQKQARQPEPRRALTASLLVLVGALVLYTALAWWRPVTVGNLRYLAYASPAIALLAAAGVASLRGRRTKLTWAVLGATVAACALVWAHPLLGDFTRLHRWESFFPAVGLLWVALYSLPARIRRAAPVLVLVLGVIGLARRGEGTLHLAPTPETEAVARAAALVRPGVAGRVPIHSAHPLLAFYADGNPYDPRSFPSADNNTRATAGPGSLVFWDSHYLANRGANSTVGGFLHDPAWVFLGGTAARDSTWAGGFFLRREPDSTGTPPVPDLVRGGMGRAAWSGVADVAQTGLPSFRVAVREDPDNPNRWRDLALALDIAGRTAEARLALARAERLDPDNPRNDLVRASFLRHARRYEDAYETIRRALVRRPDDADIQMAAAQILIQAGRSAEAGPYLLRAAAGLPHRWEVQYMAGRYLFERGVWDQAEQRLQRAVRLNPRAVAPRVFLARALAAQGETRRAESALRALIRRRPAVPEGYLYLGDLLVAAGRGKEATAVWREGLAKAGNDERIVSRLRKQRIPG